MRRILLSLRSRLRDLGLLYLIAEHFWAGLSGWITLAAGITFAAFATAAMASAATTHSKAVNTEQRLNSLVTSVGAIKSAQGTFGGFAGSNNSYSMSAGTRVTYDAGSSNQGGSGSHTSGQVGGAAAHYHDMTHYHTSSADMQNVFNALQGSFADVDSRLNSMFSALQRAGIL